MKETLTLLPYSGFDDGLRTLTGFETLSGLRHLPSDEALTLEFILH